MMKLKKLIILAVAPMMCLAASAQDFTPKKGDFTVAATLSYNSNTSTNIGYMSGNSNTYYAPSVTNNNWMDKDLAVGLEGGWFFSDNWKVSIGGGVNISNNPGEEPVEGAVEYEGGTLGSIPSYSRVNETGYVRFHVFAGIDRYFNINVDNLMPYVGYRLGYAYGNSTAKGDETWMGKSVSESFNVRNAITAGMDYFLSEAFFVGAQVDPFAYTYNKQAYKPQEGLGTLKASNHNFAFLAAPTLKVGFKF